MWKRSVPIEIISKINDSCIRDFGLRPASEQPWCIDDWLKLVSEVGFKTVFADTLESYVLKHKVPLVPAVSWRVYTSKILTRLYQIKSYLTPNLMIRRAKYRKLLKQHRSDGQYIENRILILRKP